MQIDDKFPKSMLEAIRYFADPDVCVDFVASMRWPDGVTCPHCDGQRVSYLSSRRIWKCMAKDCHKQFSVKTGSVFEDSPITLDKWLTAVWLVVNCKNGISSYELMRDLKVTQKSAWFMLHRIRLALKNTSWEKIGGNGAIEVDETHFGPNTRKMHAGKRTRLAKEGYQKPVVFGMLDRESRQVRAKVVPNVKRETLQNEILNQIEKGSKVYTDRYTGYDNLAAQEYVHETVNHVEEYVRGQVHTQGIENFWSLLKRGLRGTYVAVEPFHLDRYVDEQVFRFNNRATKDNPLDDTDRFMLAVSQIAGKRLTYAELTGKVGETSF
ncbi:IS1595 family transposase [Alloacidobacterium dinghuense]|uniref:IS1595 family transposase n=1 Tax=Alloacidobacterium dinghuense TaxID=2763107 RepID=A0A7G8BP54_9BACT|nr:IS1595 family transposase [Alloacidobacterium dinghuense]QNI34324.1 IS1595 family transposase [Alloacidobacterium dinghuense]